LLPVVLIALHSFFKNEIILFISEPIVALMISFALSIYLLGLKRKIPWTEVQQWLIDSIKEVAPLILTFAGAGAFKEMLQLMKVGEEVMKLTNGSSLNPLIIAWSIAALLRIVTGSSTVSGITTAGLISPFIVQHSVNPNLLVLSIGAGSMVMSHVNDTGFWLYKEYFGVSVKDSLRSWTIMETILGIVGLLGVLVLQYFI
jgi:Gnt-I system high-affinity gluconate transporter